MPFLLNKAHSPHESEESGLAPLKLERRRAVAGQCRTLDWHPRGPRHHDGCLGRQWGTPPDLNIRPRKRVFATEDLSAAISVRALQPEGFDCPEAPRHSAA